MFNNSVADNGMNRNNPKYSEIVLHTCPDCGECAEHGLYEQSFRPKLDKILIVEDCLSCKNTRVIKAYRNGLEVEVKR